MIIFIIIIWLLLSYLQVDIYIKSVSPDIRALCVRLLFTIATNTEESTLEALQSTRSWLTLGDFIKSNAKNTGDSFFLMLNNKILMEIIHWTWLIAISDLFSFLWSDPNCLIMYCYFISLLYAGKLKPFIHRSVLDNLLRLLMSRCGEESFSTELQSELLMFIQHPSALGVNVLDSASLSILISQAFQKVIISLRVNNNSWLI